MFFDSCEEGGHYGALMDDDLGCIGVGYFAFDMDYHTVIVNYYDKKTCKCNEDFSKNRCFVDTDKDSSSALT